MKKTFYSYIGRGSRRAYGFGATASPPSLTSYTAVVIPSDVLTFMTGSYVNNIYSQKLPDQKLLDPYEQYMSSLINMVVAAYNKSQTSDAPLQYAQTITDDLNYFKSYMVQKLQVQNNIGTPTATSQFYDTYYGDITTFNNVSAWLIDQANLYNQQQIDTGVLQASSNTLNTSSAKYTFYTTYLIPIANNFVANDQQFIKNVFVDEVDGAVTLDDLVKAVSMIKPYVSYAALTQVMLFGPQMVLGATLASDVLNADNVAATYAQRNINAEVANITSKYNSVVASLGEWLSTGTDALFQQHIQNYINGYNDPNNPAYSVSPTGTQIVQNFINAVYSGLSSAIGAGANTSIDPTNALSQAQAALAAENLPADVLAQAQAVLQQAIPLALTSQPTNPGAKGFLPLLILGGFGLYFYKKFSE